MGKSLVAAVSKSLVAAVILGWLVTPAASQHSSDQAHQASSPFGQKMFAAMDRMHADMAAHRQTGDPDRDFLAMMIPHHAGAVEMARLILIYGRDPLVRQLAEDIIAGQQAEIAGMQARLNVLDRGPDPRPGGFPAVSGTRGP
jgi:uncharacterized protein (DUF305 family)